VSLKHLVLVQDYVIDGNGENMNDKFVAGLNGCCACVLFCNLRGLLKDV